MDTRKLINRLGRIYPKRYSSAFDFVGRQIGKLKPSTNKIVVALDFDEEIYSATKEVGPDLIITHHPFIFGRYNEVLKNDPKKALLTAKVLEEIGCPIYSFHTNFDAAPGGMNDSLAKKLKLNNVRQSIAEPCMRIGELPEEMVMEDLVKMLLEVTGASFAEYVNYGSKMIKTIAFIAGGGSSYFKIAKEEGADVYISGDWPHHVRRDIITSRYNYIDLPHEIERMFTEIMKETLLSIDPTLEVVTFDHEKEPSIMLKD